MPRLSARRGRTFGKLASKAWTSPHILVYFDGVILEWPSMSEIRLLCLMFLWALRCLDDHSLAPMNFLGAFRKPMAVSTHFRSLGTIHDISNVPSMAPAFIASRKHSTSKASIFPLEK